MDEYEMYKARYDELKEKEIYKDIKRHFKNSETTEDADAFYMKVLETIGVCYKDRIKEIREADNDKG